MDDLRRIRGLERAKDLVLELEERKRARASSSSTGLVDSSAGSVESAEKSKALEEIVELLKLFENWTTKAVLERSGEVMDLLEAEEDEEEEAEQEVDPELRELRDLARALGRDADLIRGYELIVIVRNEIDPAGQQQQQHGRSVLREVRVRVAPYMTCEELFAAALEWWVYEEAEEARSRFYLTDDAGVWLDPTAFVRTATARLRTTSSSDSFPVFHLRRKPFSPDDVLRRTEGPAAGELAASEDRGERRARELAYLLRAREEEVGEKGLAPSSLAEELPPRRRRPVASARAWDLDPVLASPRAVCVDLALFVVMFVILCLFVVSSHPSDHVELRRAVTMNLVSPPFPSQPDGLEDASIYLHQVISIPNVYAYLVGPFAGALSAPEVFFGGGQTLVTNSGRVRFRQHRVDPVTCTNDPRNIVCYPEWSNDAAARAPDPARGTFYESGFPVAVGAASGTRYAAAAYFLDVYLSAEDLKRFVLEELVGKQWFDRGTRYVSMEFVVYNANLDLFLQCVVSFEQNEMGRITPSHEWTALAARQGTTALTSTELVYVVLLYVLLVYIAMQTMAYAFVARRIVALHEAKTSRRAAQSEREEEAEPPADPASPCERGLRTWGRWFNLLLFGDEWLGPSTASRIRLNILALACGLAGTSCLLRGFQTDLSSIALRNAAGTSRDPAGDFDSGFAVQRASHFLVTGSVLEAFTAIFVALRLYTLTKSGNRIRRWRHAAAFALPHLFVLVFVLVGSLFAFALAAYGSMARYSYIEGNGVQSVPSAFLTIITALLGGTSAADWDVITGENPNTLGYLLYGMCYYGVAVVLYRYATPVWLHGMDRACEEMQSDPSEERFDVPNEFRNFVGSFQGLFAAVYANHIGGGEPRASQAAPTPREAASADPEGDVRARGFVEGRDL